MQSDEALKLAQTAERAGWVEQARCIRSLVAERDEAVRKGEQVCVAAGNAMLEHDTALRLLRSSETYIEKVEAERDALMTKLAEVEENHDLRAADALVFKRERDAALSVLRDWVAAIDSEYDSVARVGALSPAERQCLARARALLEGKP